MPAQKGRDLLLKIETDVPGTFQTVAGIRTHTLTLNTSVVDSTDCYSPGAWRELLAGAGLRSVTVRGSGLFKDAASDALMTSLFIKGDLGTFQMIIPDFMTITGPFQIVSMDYQGQYDEALTFTIDLQSAGLLTFHML